MADLWSPGASPPPNQPGAAPAAGHPPSAFSQMQFAKAMRFALRDHEASIQAIGWIQILSGGLGTWIASLLLLASRRRDFQIHVSGSIEPFTALLLIRVFLGVVLGLSLLKVVVGGGLLRLRAWARWGQLVLIGLGHSGRSGM